jgi:type IV pilus assembly protein PilB
VSDKRKPIGQILLGRGIINEEQLTTALARQERWGRRLGENLVALGFISERQLAKVLGEIYRMPTVDVRTAPISREALGMVPEEFCRKHHLIPIKVKMVEGKEQLIVAVSDPSNVEAIDELRFLVKYPVFEVLSTVSDINDVMLNYFQGASAATFDLLREVTLSRIKEDVAVEIVQDEKLNRQEISEGKSFPDAKKAQPDSLEKKLNALVQILIDKGVISEEQGRQLLTL